MPMYCGSVAKLSVMSTTYFVDRAGTLTNVRRTAVGGMLVDAKLAKVGVLEYQDGERVIRRYNPAAVLEAALPQVSTIPVTNRHPDKFVDTTNYSKFAAGHVVGAARFEDGHIHATLAINDEKLIRDIEMGIAREVSLGYSAVHDGKPGEADGETWDEARIELILNHAAVVPAGRAGKSVRLCLDSADIPAIDQEVIVAVLKIAGSEVQVDSAQPAIDALEAKLVVAEQAVTDSAAKVAELEAKLAEVTTDSFIDAKVAERIEAQKAEDAFQASVARVKARFPKLDESKLTNRDYVAALDFAAQSDTAQLDGTATLAPATDAVDTVHPAVKRKQAQREAYKNLGK
jgi:Drexlerviridae head maturation protease